MRKMLRFYFACRGNPADAAAQGRRFCAGRLVHSCRTASAAENALGAFSQGSQFSSVEWKNFLEAWRF
jgi:hypothetical protein